MLIVYSCALTDIVYNYVLVVMEYSRAIVMIMPSHVLHLL